MRELYSRGEITKLEKRKKLSILFLIFGFVVLVGEVTAFIFLTNRGNDLLMQIIATIITFLTISFLIFDGLYLLRGSIIRIKQLKSVFDSKGEIIEGVFSFNGEVCYQDGVRMLGVLVHGSNADRVVFVEEEAGLNPASIVAGEVRKGTLTAVEEKNG